VSVRPPLLLALCVALVALEPVVSDGAAQKQSEAPWIAAVRIIKNGGPSGSGVYLRSGLVITAAHLTDPNSNMGVHIAGLNLSAKMLKQGVFQDVDLSLLSFDEAQLPASAVLPQMQLCEARPWPGDPVIVVDAERATRSHIAAPQVLAFSIRTKFSTLISDVATTGNSGSGVFDPNRKCLLGIMSRKFVVNTPQGEKNIAKYFVPAWEIRDFMRAASVPPE
jgi:Trypsin-like peptidase domain